MTRLRHICGVSSFTCVYLLWYIMLSVVCMMWFFHRCVRCDFFINVVCLVSNVCTFCSMVHGVWAVGYGAFICVTWHIHMRFIKGVGVLLYSLVCVTWPIHTCDVLCAYVRHNRAWHNHTCDMFHSYLLLYSPACMTWHVYMCDMFICVTCFIRMCDMTQSYVQHASFIRAAVESGVCNMTCLYVWHASFVCAT